MSFDTAEASKLKKRPLPQNLTPIQSSQLQQEQFRKSVSSGNGYSSTARAVVQFNNVEQFNNFFLRQTQDAKANFDTNHERGGKAVARGYQNISEKANNFMKRFSPVLEVVQSCGAPYGGIAVGVVSVLFVVAASKNAVEESLARTISAIMDRLPGIEMYKRLYNENHELDQRLQAHVARVYEGFMAFCIKATEYYNKRGSRRWLQAFLGTDSIGDEADNVQSLIVEMRLFCEELLAKNVDQVRQINLEQSRELAEQTRNLELIQSQNLEQKEIIVRLESELGGLRASKDQDNVREVQRLLRQELFSEKELYNEFCKHRDTLERNIEYNGRYFQQMQGPKLQSFQMCDEHQSWLNAQQACMIMVVGFNNPGAGIMLDDCWLSPIAFANITEQAAQVSTQVSAYYVFPSGGELLYEALSIIFIQLLKKQSNVLRATKRYDELRSDLLQFNNTDKANSSSRAAKVARLGAFQKVASRVIDLFDEDQEVVIVVDRADRCERLREGEDQRKAFLKMLVKMVEEARCKLRILVVLNGNRWRLEGHEDELEITMKERFIKYTAQQGLIQ